MNSRQSWIGGCSSHKITTSTSHNLIKSEMANPTGDFQESRFFPTFCPPIPYSQRPNVVEVVQIRTFEVFIFFTLKNIERRWWVLYFQRLLSSAELKPWLHVYDRVEWYNPNPIYSINLSTKDRGHRDIEFLEVQQFYLKAEAELGFRRRSGPFVALYSKRRSW